MARPLEFSLAQYSNEPLRVSVPFPWLADQWPLPPGSRFSSDLRRARGDPDILLHLQSDDSSIIATWDAVNTRVLLTFEAPMDDLAGIETPLRLYGDVVLERPRPGSAAPRRDVIGVYDFLLTAGLTYD